MGKEQFIEAELARFEENHPHPFRAAVSANWNGGDYSYGSHAERRGDYADDTVGWTRDKTHAERLLAEAWELAEERNELIRQEDET